MSELKRLVIIMALVAIAGSISVRIPPAKGIANVYLFPDFVTGEIGTTFKVDLMISGVANDFGWQVTLGWNASVLDFVNATQGDFLKGIEENPTQWLNKTYQDQVGNDTIVIGCTRLGYVSGVDGSGILATIAFRIEVKGETPLDLSQTKLADSRPTPYPIEHTATDGYFSNVAGLPVARFSMTPSPALIGETVIFDGSASFDLDGTIERYFWDFGDGSNYSAVDDPIASHAYAEGNPSYSVTLKVTDNEGWNNTLTHGLKVRFARDVAITTVALSDVSVTVGDKVTITVTALNDGAETVTFDVTVYYGLTEAELQEAASPKAISNLAMGRNSTVSFEWDTSGVEPGDYLIRAVAQPLSGETYTSNNFKFGSEIRLDAPAQFPWTLVIAVIAIVVVAGIGVFFYMRRRGKSPSGPV